jgi:hypothetical protein
MNAFRLCKMLGLPHPDLLPMSSAQLAEWWAFFIAEEMGPAMAPQTPDEQRAILKAALGRK